MALNYENNLNGMRQTVSQSCLYSAMNPYPVHASTASQNAYTAQTAKSQIYAQEAMMHHLSNLTGSSLRQPVYQQSYPVAGDLNELSNLQSISMALGSGYGHFYGATLQALNPTAQMTTDYTGLIDASNASKCPKQVHPFYWRKRGNSEPAEGMTRTRDKYRVVYTDKQRVGLEKAFKENKFITLEKKKEISKELDLSERQIKIWFQNRRAKERRQKRKTETEQTDHVMPDISDTEVDGIANNAAIVNAESNDDLLGVDLPSHTYPTLNSLEEPPAKSQCLYQQNGSKTSDIAAVPEMQQHQTARRVPVSPSEWDQTSALMTTCNMSPFTANPDWNLMYRT